MTHTMTERMVQLKVVQIREKVTGTRVRDSDTGGVAWMFWDMKTEEKQLGLVPGLSQKVVRHRPPWLAHGLAVAPRVCVLAPCEP